MRTLRRLRRFRNLRAVSSGAWPPADGVAVRYAASEWKGVLVRTRTPALPNHPRPTFAVGLRPAVAVTLIETGAESGAIPRGRPCQRAIRLRRSRSRDSLPDRVCRAALVRQTMAHPGDGPARRWQHGRQPVGMAACLPVCAVACLPGWPAASLPVCMPGDLPALARCRIGRARLWPATTFPSKRSNAAPGDPPRRRRPTGRPPSSSVTAKAACTMTPPSEGRGLLHSRPRRCARLGAGPGRALECRRGARDPLKFGDRPRMGTGLAVRAVGRRAD
jgi:hypothetical protein